MYKNSFFHKKNQTTAIQILGLFININLKDRKFSKNEMNLNPWELMRKLNHKK
ncbi:hypothetical protein LEP1GSC150_2552 [Leptospira interrogans serovar Copenhageni str. LT2050]|uniref:Uncharacterized protein n=1 Tax=Leptospira interrogans serovar Copenhageni str. LT2050 TaxID=1001598 RepID=M3H5J3_LEPIT|nr:hypothetical protein LEP1GSC150_2552 [Leptospira interrogans serovar Copenhageni str. LT2050]